MMRFLSCLAVEHDIRLVFLAGLVCLLSCHAAVSMIDKARDAGQKKRRILTAAAGVASGFGIWATHFIAMLAYRSDIAMLYLPSLTFLSLAVVIAFTTAAVWRFLVAGGTSAVMQGALLFAGGVAAMHFTGMAAVELSAEKSWDPVYVTVALLFALAFSAGALHLLSRGRVSTARRGAAVLMMTLGVVFLHFLSMTAITLTLNSDQLAGEATFSPLVLGAIIGLVALSVLIGVLLAIHVAERVNNHTSKMERNFSLLVRGVTDYAIYMLDPQGNVSSWNAGAERAKGYKAEEIIGRHFSCFFSPEDRLKGEPEKTLARALAEKGVRTENWRYRKDGSRFWASVAIDPIHDERGAHIGFAKITQDTTAVKEANDRVLEATANLDIALENMSHGLCLFSANEELLISNSRFRELFRVSEELAAARPTFRSLIEMSISRVVQDPVAVERALEDAYRRHRMELIGSGGGDVVETLRGSSSVLIRYRTLADGGWVATYEDITERLNSERQISHLARHDGLTGLPNRLAFSEYLQNALDRAAAEGGQVAVAGIDLDRFKEVNDHYGHDAGDFVLKTLASRMNAITGDGEFFARMGGDEFIAVKQYGSMEALQAFVGRIETVLGSEVRFDEVVVKTGGSLGIALYPQDATTADKLIANADLAMYRAKNSIHQTVCFYEIEMDEAARRHRMLANDLWQAIEQEQFSLHYQVQKAVSSGETTGYEALLRWDHPERGRIPPSDFIPIAEECGAIVPIGAWVLRRACHDAVARGDGYKIAVNLSPVQLAHGDIVPLVISALADSGLDPRRLELEITESTIISNKERALETLRQIKLLGVTVAIDDFGTGYSSLETLRSFPFDKIKLDRSFMLEVESSPQAKAIIRAILALGQSLDVPVLAEGVETQSQLDILKTEGCDEAQGYLLGRPAPYVPKETLVEESRIVA